MASSADETLAPAASSETLGGGPQNPNTEPSATSRLLERGDAVGRFVVLSKLGAGGMGVVYAAYDPELDRKVALKMLLAGVDGSASGSGRNRLLREAQALARFSHPEIVSIHDVGEHESGVWLAMEFVDGSTLGGWASKGRSWREVLDVMLAAGRGVAAAHAAGLIHRDLKPDNIMVGNDGRVRVMDFGLTRPAETPAGRKPEHDATQRPLDSRLTQLGSLVGTPAYMAPEQFLAEEVTPAADQFAFCVTLWELLFGERPFTGTSVFELSVSVVEGVIRPPPKGRGVPGWLRRACERGLAREPSARWPTMEVLLAQLGRGQARARTRNVAIGAAVILCVVAGAEGVRRHDRGERVAACEAEGAVVFEAWNEAAHAALRANLVASGSGYAAESTDKLMPWLDDHAAAWQTARSQACLDATVEQREGWDADMLDRSRWCLDERRLEFDALVTQLTQGDARMLEEAVPAASGLSSVEPCLDQALLARLPAPPPSDDRAEVEAIRAELSRASALQLLGEYDAGLAVARASHERALAVEWPPLLASTALRVGSLLQATGVYEEAATFEEQAYFAAAKAGAPEIALDAANHLVATMTHLARHADAHAWAKHGEVVLLQLPDPTGMREADHVQGLAGLYGATGPFEKSRELSEQVLAMREAALGPDHPAVATALNNLASEYNDKGSFDQAKQLMERALEIRRKTLGLSHPSVATTLGNLAVMAFSRGEFDEAVALQTQAIELLEQAVGSDHPNVASSLSNLAAMHLQRREFELAKPLQERALLMHEKTFGAEHPEVATDLVILSNIERSLGRKAEAKQLAERALVIREKTFGADHVAVGGSLSILGDIHIAMGEYDQAKPFFERALVIYETSAGLEHPNLGPILNGLAEVALEQKRPADALALAERAVRIREGGPAGPLAESRFAVARALTDLGSDPARGISEAEKARDTYRELGLEERLARVEAWLAEQASR